MGFDTYLTVDDRIVFDWRKYASPLPRLLFRPDQWHYEPSDEDDINVGVWFRTTAEDALANMAAAGLGWAATVAAYGDYRTPDGFAAGLHLGHLAGSELTDSEIERHGEAFRQLSPVHDLSSLGTLMAHQWASGADEVLLLEDLTFDERLPAGHHLAMKVYRAGIDAKIDDPFAAARAAENLAYLDSEAPLLAWPMVVSIFLRHIAADAQVEYDLSGHAATEADASRAFDAETYCRTWWSDASSGMAAHARTLGRLFAVVTSLDGDLGREYWFARAAELLERLVLPHGTMRKKGDALEDLVEALVLTEAPELSVLEKNVRTRSEEIDLLVANSLRDPFWVGHGSPLILIECKNTTGRVGIPELRVFESKIKDRGARCKIGIFVSTNGFTRPFLDRLSSFQASGGVIYAVDGNQLAELIREKTRLTDWLRVSTR